MAKSALTSLEAACLATQCNRLLVDDESQPKQIGFFHDDRLLEVWHQPDDGIIGQIFWARVSQVFTQHQRASLRLSNGQAASMRLPRSAKLTSGQMIIVTITAEAYADKPAAAILGAEIAGALVVLKLDGQGIIRSSFKKARSSSGRSSGARSSGAGVSGAGVSGAGVSGAPGPGTTQAGQKAADAGDAENDSTSSHDNRSRLGDQDASHASAALESDVRETCKSLFVPNTDVILRRRAALATPSDIKAEISMLARYAQSVTNEMQHAPAEPTQIFGGLPALILARLHAPDAHLISQADHHLWDVLVETSDKASSDKVYGPSGLCLWFHQSRALMAVDVDSADSKLGPEALVAEACNVLMQQIRLRQLAGILIFDLPRLNRAGREKALDWLEKLASCDPRHPDILGFGPAGMIELRIRHGRASQKDVEAAAARLV